MEEGERIQGREGISQGPPRKEKEEANSAKTPVARPPGRWWKVAVVLALALVVGLVIVVKEKGGPGASPEGSRSEEGASSPDLSFPAEAVLATVNGQEITLYELEKALRQLPASYRAEYNCQKHEFLEELITRMLLLQEARRLGIDKTEGYRKESAQQEALGGSKEELLINLLLRREVVEKVNVTDEEMKRFFEENRMQFPMNTSFEKVKESLRASLLEQKQYQALEEYISGLKEEANIARNRTWVDAQKKLTADNPLDHALAGDKPVLADFGRGTCIPCKMMMPILAELSEELKGRVNVLILDTADYGYLARRYRIRMIPTQIFFDASGKEIYRHSGFMSREDILKKLRELNMLQE